MGILESAQAVIVVCTRDRVRAIEFYRNTLGLTMRHEDAFAAVFDAGLERACSVRSRSGAVNVLGTTDRPTLNARRSFIATPHAHAGGPPAPRRPTGSS